MIKKQVLKEFINSVDSTPSLRNFYNSKIKELHLLLKETGNNIKDKAIQIKVQEVSKLLVELDKTDKVDSDNLVDLLQYYELIQEIPSSKWGTNINLTKCPKKHPQEDAEKELDKPKTGFQVGQVTYSSDDGQI